MKILHRTCAGLDVHAAFVTVCTRTVSRRKVSTDETRVATTTHDLLGLVSWLEARGIPHVVMEARRASPGSRSGISWRVRSN